MFLMQNVTQVKLEAVDKWIEIGNILNFYSWMCDHSSLFKHDLKFINIWLGK